MLINYLKNKRGSANSSPWGVVVWRAMNRETMMKVKENDGGG
jgi:hypothetical protein